MLQKIQKGAEISKECNNVKADANFLINLQTAYHYVRINSAKN